VGLLHGIHAGGRVLAQASPTNPCNRTLTPPSSLRLSSSQACYSPIEFDFLQFHATRLGEYRRRKAEFVGEARRMFANGQ
jgi:hypothetical protein